MTLMTDYDLNMGWLSSADHKEQYQGEWVVLCAGKLIAHGKCYTELYRKYGSFMSDHNLIVKVEK